MKKSTKEICYEELEILSCSCFSGNVTPIVFNILKDTEYPEQLLKYLGYEKKSERKIAKEDRPKSFKDLFGSCPIIQETRR